MDQGHYQDIGQYLRESRESLRVPISQAAKDLFIREKYLKAIEAGDLDVLPGKAYTRGYIKTYADYLRLDSQQVLERYGDLFGEKPAAFFIPEPGQKQNIPGGRLLLFSLIGLGGLYSLWYFEWVGQASLPGAVAEVPQSLLHLLDKTPPAAMDRVWADCLGKGGDGCFNALRARQWIPQAQTGEEIELYDIPFTQPAPDKP